MEDVLKLLTAHLAIRDRKDTSPRALTDAKRWAFARGDYVGENYAYWTGLIPKSEDAKVEWAKSIVTEDVMGACLNRYVSGMLGKDWEWTLVAEGSEDALPPEEERVEALALWHRDADAWGALKELAFGVLALGRGSLRVYIPAAYGEEGEASTEGVTDLASALERIHVMFVPAAPSLDMGDGGAIRDNYGREVGYFYRYAITVDGKPETRYEVHTPEEVGVFKKDGDKYVPDGKVLPNPLYDPALVRRPRYLMFEVSRDGGSTITQPAADLASDLCVTHTNKRRNSDLGGHRQYILIDGQDPEDDQGNPQPFTFGPRVVASVKSLTADAEGNRLESPLKASLSVIDPVDPKVFLEHANDTRRALHSHFDQLWALQGESNLSGESRRESRAAFDARLTLEAEPLNRAAKWLIETVLRLAGAMLSRANIADGVECVPRLYLNVSPTDLNTYQALREANLAGQYPLEALLESTPTVQDAATALAQLQGERADNITLINALRELGLDAAEWLTLLSKAGVPVSPESIQRAQDMADAGLEALSTAESEGEDGTTNTDG